MFRKLGHVLLVVALLAATGMHWAVLQSVAWTTMLADNVCICSFTEAVQKTFDGKHPCCLCNQIAAGKKSEKKTEFCASLKQLEFYSERTAFVFNASQVFRLLPEIDFSTHALEHQPPTPPPRPLFS